VTSLRTAKRVRSVEDVAGEFVGDQLATAYWTTNATCRPSAGRAQPAAADEFSPRLREGGCCARRIPEPGVRRRQHPQSHIRPIGELTRRLRALPGSRTVIAYAVPVPVLHGRDDAVRALSRRGYRASRLDNRYPERPRRNARGELRAPRRGDPKPLSRNADQGRMVP
jgi:hypothetical protein